MKLKTLTKEEREKMIKENENNKIGKEKWKKKLKEKKNTSMRKVKFHM